MKRVLVASKQAYCCSHAVTQCRSMVVTNRKQKHYHPATSMFIGCLPLKTTARLQPIYAGSVISGLSTTQLPLACSVSSHQHLRQPAITHHQQHCWVLRDALSDTCITPSLSNHHHLQNCHHPTIMNMACAPSPHLVATLNYSPHTNTRDRTSMPRHPNHKRA